MLSVYNLISGTLKKYPLPDHWDCSGIAAADGSIFLLNPTIPDKKRQVLYLNSRNSNSLSPFINMPGITRMLYCR
jgi:hypothetical protein